MIRVALRGSRGPEAPRVPDGARDRARRGDGERHVRAHGHDRQRVQRHLHASRTRTRTPSSAASRRTSTSRATTSQRPRSRRVAPADRCASCRTSRPPPGTSPTRRRRRSSTARARRSRRAARRRSGSASTTRSLGSTRCELTAGRWPSAPNEVVIDRATAGEQHYKVGQTVQRRHAQAGAPVQARRRSRSTATSSRSGRDLRRVHDPDGAEALRPQGPARRDLGRGEARDFAGALVERDRRRPAGHGHGADGDGRRQGGR